MPLVEEDVLRVLVVPRWRPELDEGSAGAHEQRRSEVGPVGRNHDVDLLKLADVGRNIRQADDLAMELPAANRDAAALPDELLGVCDEAVPRPFRQADDEAARVGGWRRPAPEGDERLEDGGPIAPVGVVARKVRRPRARVIAAPKDTSE